jgi:hypothetical protein
MKPDNVHRLEHAETQTVRLLTVLETEAAAARAGRDAAPSRTQEKARFAQHFARLRNRVLAQQKKLERIRRLLREDAATRQAS